MGVWIEITRYKTICLFNRVTPCMGVWIEIRETLNKKVFVRSLPVWECGLKYRGASIMRVPYGHSLYGSVD